MPATQVKHSITGSIWQIRAVQEKELYLYTHTLGLPEIIARVLLGRNVLPEAIEDFLAPTIRNLLPDPSHFIDMDKASAFIAEAILTDKKIAVFGDYDVDGATSAALLKRFFTAIGCEVILYIPDRLKEGYGPNSYAMTQLHKQGVNICITVDCGTMAFTALAEAKKMGMDVIVLDHHLSAENLPEAYAVVNPNRIDEHSPYGHLAAVGVTFLFIVALRQKLLSAGWFTHTSQPDLMQYLDLVALGTVCDVVPLININRAFVRQGLAILRKRNNKGLRALCDVAMLQETPTAYHLGFVLGPRVNAGGRVGKAPMGSHLLSSQDDEEVTALAQQLNAYNLERKALEIQVLEEALLQAETLPKEQKVIIVYAENWHPGVIGIVASRLKEKYHKPCAVISIMDDMGKGSARSISGVDFGASIVKAQQQGLLVNGGGHAMAAGFTVEKKNILALQHFLDEQFSYCQASFAIKQCSYDGCLTIGAITLDLIKHLAKMEPYGVGNAEPKFLFKNVHIIRSDIVGAKHIRCIIGQEHHPTRSSIKAMAFNSIATPLENYLLKPGCRLDILGRIRQNNWQNIARPELLIDDITI